MPTKRIASALLILSLALSGNAQTNDAQALVQQGRDASTRGDNDKAVELLEKAVELQPKNAAYRFQLANAYGTAALAASMFAKMSLGKKMKESLDRAIELDPNLIPARQLLLELDLAPAVFGGSESAAKEQATEIRKRDAIEGHRAFARIHVAAKELDLARREYTDLVKEQPKSVRAHYLYAIYLLNTEKDFKGATAELEAALTLDASYMPAYFRIGHAAALSGTNFARGEQSLKKYLTYKPKDDEPAVARAYYWLGGIYEKQGKIAEAKASYAASLKLNPTQKDVDEALKRVS